MEEQRLAFEKEKSFILAQLQVDKSKLEEGMKKLEDDKKRFQDLLQSQIDVTDLDVGGTHKFSVSTKVLTSI